jgi:hypothetical protein
MYNLLFFAFKQSQDSSVGVATDYRLNDWGSNSGRGQEFFFMMPCPDWLWSPPSLLSNGYWQFFPGGGVKRQRHEADHPPPSSAKIKECVELYLHSPNTSSWCGA